MGLILVTLYSVVTHSACHITQPAFLLMEVAFSDLIEFIFTEVLNFHVTSLIIIACLELSDFPSCHSLQVFLIFQTVNLVLFSST